MCNANRYKRHKEITSVTKWKKGNQTIQTQIHKYQNGQTKENWYSSTNGNNIDDIRKPYQACQIA